MRKRATRPPATRRESRRLVLVVLSALTVAVLVWQVRRPGSAPAHDAPSVPATVATASAARSWAPPAAPRRVETTRGPATARLIQDVYADGDDVCPNEPVTITVHAGADHPFPVHVRIGASAGTQTVVSFRKPGEYPILVAADDRRGALDTRSLTIHVSDCAGSFQFVRVEARSIPSHPDTQGITARPIFARPECRTDAGKVDDGCASAPRPGDKLRFDWDFGDGQHATTDEPYVEHDYSSRPQDSVDSTFIVRAVVTSSASGELQGASSVTLPNVAYQNKRVAHRITPDAFADGLTREDSAYRFAAHFVNHESRPLHLDRAKVQMIPCDAPTQASTYDVSARQVIDSADLPPGASTTSGWLRGTFAAEAYCQVIVTFGGDGPDGLPIDAVLGLQLKPTEPTRVVSSEDSDPAAQAEITRTLEAMRLLGRDPNGGSVTSEEIRALQQRGLLK